MRRIWCCILGIGFFLVLCHFTTAFAADTSNNGPETQYLMFQIFTYNSPLIPAGPDVMAAISNTVDDIVTTIGTTGDKRHKLGFTIGPLTFDQTDEEIRQLIRKSFDIARAENVAVAFHIDDSMFFGTRKDLVNNPDNIEWLDWNKTPSTGRQVDWSATPGKLAPQMCFNSIGVKNAVAQRALLISEEINKGVLALRKDGKDELFAGVIAGWETSIGTDFDTHRDLGYCALSHRGFSAAHPPADMDAERVSIVKEFIELWASGLAKNGIPKEKIYAHIAFTPQGIGPVHFVTPDVAFSSFYRPGFSTYPVPGMFDRIHQELTKHGNPPWASSEGTNVVPNGFPGEATMETYLAKMFNHGATFVNIFSWGIGGEAEKHRNLFRLATENNEAILSYRKFLEGNLLQEALGPSPQIVFQGKIHNIQIKLPAWVQRTHRQDDVRPLLKELHTLIKSGQFQEGDRMADKILALIQQQ